MQLPRGSSKSSKSSLGSHVSILGVYRPSPRQKHSIASVETFLQSYPSGVMGCVVRAWYQVDRSTRNGELYERRFLLLSDHPLAELPAPKNKAKGEILFYAGIGEHFYDGINLGSLRDRPHESCGPVSVTPPFTPFCTLLIPSRSAGNETSFRWIHRMSYCLLISWASGRNETKVSPDRPAPTTREWPAIR